jgi:hypothetical protein
LGMSKDKISVFIGQFDVRTKSSLGGNGQVHLGGWRAEGPATPNSAAQSGSSKSGDCVIRWNVSK